MRLLSTLQNKRVIYSALVAMGLLLLWIGWDLLFFLTDDAHITFRYVSNAVLGRGLVWNPAPFPPVEGYTSFLWLALLWIGWAGFGIEPPALANWMSLLCGAITLLITMRMTATMALPRSLDRYRPALVAMTMLWLLTNRTFLAWLSSGLETALFNCLFLWWFWEASRETRRARLLRLTTAATLTALTRPDGLLLVAATVGVVAWQYRRSWRVAGVWLQASPLLLVAAHVGWRRAYYGYWLPNTYYAKVRDAWPEAGLRYAACFVLEYAVWIWVLLLLGAIGVAFRQGIKESLAKAGLGRCVAVGVVLFHVMYYTILVGGDHFEYRVYSHILPLLFISAIWATTRLSERPVVVFTALFGFLVSSYPIPWIHWAESQAMTTRPATFRLRVPIAQHLPIHLAPVIEQWDRWQAWLIERSVCMRHQEHKVFHDHMQRGLPSRAEGAELKWERRVVTASPIVGVLGWVFPNVAIIDEQGLTDSIIARNPAFRDPGKPRQMAHDRIPPPGYLDCFNPNLEVRLHERFKVLGIPKPRTDEDIRRCLSKKYY